MTYILIRFKSRFQNDVDMTCTLVDAEDYPRGDVDVYKIRDARGRINCLRNDLNALMKEISEGLEQHFSELKVEDKSKEGDTKPATKTPETTRAPPAELVNKESFAVIDSIIEGSPADECGLCVRDEVVEFGSVNAKNFQNLTQLAEIAQHKLNQKVAVVIKRKRENGSTLVDTIQLVPKKWSGRGYLGMVIKPINKT